MKLYFGVRKMVSSQSGPGLGKTLGAHQVLSPVTMSQLHSLRY